MDPEIRPYTGRDRAFVTGLYRLSLTDIQRKVPGLAIPPGFAGMYLPKLIRRAQAKGGCLRIAELDGKRAGFVAVHPKTDPAPWDVTEGRFGLVMELHVQPKFQRRGIGRALLRDAESFCRDAGFDWITLGVFPANPGARRFYESVGYREAYIYMGKPLGTRRR
jgi:GNAT superfamily N-acetyltransferase